MPVYTGTIQLEGDPQVLPAVISVDEGRINLTSKSKPIGSWTLREAGFSHRDGGISMSVDGEQVMLRVENIDSLARAVGLRSESETRRRASFTQPHPSQQEAEPDRTRRSAEEIAREVADELDPLVAEVREGLTHITLSRNAWIGVGVGLVLALLLPGISVPILSIVGALGVVAGAAAMLEPAIADRIPEPFTPVQILAAGAASFLLVMVILVIR